MTCLLSLSLSVPLCYRVLHYTIIYIPELINANPSSEYLPPVYIYIIYNHHHPLCPAIADKPEVTAVTRWLHSAPEIRARLECLVVAYPEAHLDWYLENEKVIRTQRVMRYKQDTTLDDGSPAQLHSLVIRSVQSKDLGHYTCRANNELGQSEASLELSGVAKPPLLKKEIRSSSSNSYNFIWEVDSYSPIVEYQFWFRQVGVRDTAAAADREIRAACERSVYILCNMYMLYIYI